MDFLKGFKTVIGVLLLAVPQLAEIFNVAPVSTMPVWLEAALAILGTIVALYGRWDAGVRPSVMLTRAPRGR